MIKYEKGKNKKVTITILKDNDFKLSRVNLCTFELINLLTINLAAVVAYNLNKEETEEVIKMFKYNIEHYIKERLLNFEQ